MREQRAISGMLVAAALVAAESTLAQAPDIEAELGTSIVDRMPVGGAQAFPVDVGEVYAWMRVAGAEGTTLHHVWIHGEDEWSVPLAIGGSPWRTWSVKQIPPEWAGEWRVEIRDDSGNLLGALSFTIG